MQHSMVSHCVLRFLPNDDSFKNSAILTVSSTSEIAC